MFHLPNVGFTPLVGVHIKLWNFIGFYEKLTLFAGYIEKIKIF
jgi:hypothetical protein